MFIVHSYNKYSKGAKNLARALKGARSHRCKPTDKDIVINWGDGSCPYKRCLNNPTTVSLASNKLSAFRAMLREGVSVPAFVTRKEDVNWTGPTVVRHKLQGHSGEGIEIVDDKSKLPDAPLYVRYIPKQQEFRIHVARSEGTTKVIAVQRKARDLSIPDGSVNWQVRNHANGFIFAREGANPNPLVLTEACNALRAVGLDFGAVDVIWNQKEGRAYVLEINTAPGLEGQTIDDYANFFKG